MIYFFDMDEVKSVRSYADTHIAPAIYDLMEVLTKVLDEGYLGKLHQWMRLDPSHEKALVLLGIVLCEEFCYRYGTLHPLSKAFMGLQRVCGVGPLSDTISEPPVMMKGRRSPNDTTIGRHRRFYSRRAAEDRLTWSGREKPSWVS